MAGVNVWPQQLFATKPDRLGEHLPFGVSAEPRVIDVPWLTFIYVHVLNSLSCMFETSLG